MKNAPTPSNPSHNHRMEKLHWHIQHWKLDLQFIDDETAFINQLLNSDIFEPNLPNQFERIQDYLERLSKFEARKTRLRRVISKHENRLGSLLENDDEARKSNFFQGHEDLEMEVLNCSDDFKNLKAEIFNYIGGTLKKKEKQ